MKLGLIRRIDKGDLSRAGDVPKWIDPLLDTLNPFIEKVGLALQNRLTFVDNGLGKEYSGQFTTDVEKEINPRLPGQQTLRVQAVYPLTTGELFITGFKWVQKDNGNIGVTIKFSGGTEATVKLRIELG